MVIVVYDNWYSLNAAVYFETSGGSSSTHLKSTALLPVVHLNITCGQPNNMQQVWQFMTLSPPTASWSAGLILLTVPNSLMNMYWRVTKSKSLHQIQTHLNSSDKQSSMHVLHFQNLVFHETTSGLFRFSKINSALLNRPDLQYM